MDGRLRWEKEYTDGWVAYNEEDEEIGELGLQMVGRHKHWCWFQHTDAWLSPGCLEEVRRKQKELFKERK